MGEMNSRCTSMEIDLPYLPRLPAKIGTYVPPV